MWASTNAPALSQWDLEGQYLHLCHSSNHEGKEHFGTPSLSPCPWSVPEVRVGQNLRSSSYETFGSEPGECDGGMLWTVPRSHQWMLVPARPRQEQEGEVTKIMHHTFCLRGATVNPNMKMQHVLPTPACREGGSEVVPTRAVKTIPIKET